VRQLKALEGNLMEVEGLDYVGSHQWPFIYAPTSTELKIQLNSVAQWDWWNTEAASGN